MCRLFGMHAGSVPVPATYWLLDAPDSLRAQGARNPDGTGLGYFNTDGRPHLDKQPIEAGLDSEFATSARTATGTTFVAHVRYATTGEKSPENTHPFTMDGRIFAHNGAIGDLPAVDARLAALGASGLVGGQTDSERVFALITAEIDRAGGEVEAGLVAAMRWLGENVPVLALNVILATSTDMWALRWPDTHELWVWEWVASAGPRLSSDRIAARVAEPGGPEGEHEGEPEREPEGDAGADAVVGPGGIGPEADSARRASRPSVVIATERMTEDAAWRLLEPGELVHIGPHLGVDSRVVLAEPRHRLRLADMEPGLSAAMKA
ncbi:class II glutamine amidotransferase [Serinibacter salmoneus]|uniref:Glutamine amidotransferase n=1 Tax=Serinibacter salmoneus TaxID=556530 RepID=A0A2A9D1C5_9MICO|nr:class II glutamine amidotransferase [Serinibacter salmoneus]PFG20487.1 glutamine amidotransferase [Serinibacter salmoneus]